MPAGAARSDRTDQIALWMIDTAYNGESFFVRHCYFTGGLHRLTDPYRRADPQMVRTSQRRF